MVFGQKLKHSFDQKLPSNNQLSLFKKFSLYLISAKYWKSIQPSKIY